ncbi:pyruvate kinase [Tropicimonas sediminicola]|uniref:Pyruvate kinase n=1 Tax=Tropicimonas sediminicola TaxID=1031541 RepID=A0A239FDG8_9RHOB|nr:pyruvate kinase [Tropicimonas sediminicola]SNS54966.1 pyruvate kinase [Tropicimonas sediminicola]
MDISPNAPPLPPTESAADLYASVSQIRAAISREAEATLASWQPAIHRPDFLPSARNLAHYLALRKIDLRPHQDRLIALGLSSLGHCEEAVRPALDAACASLASIAGLTPEGYPPAAEFTKGRQRVAAAQAEMFGTGDGEPGTRIMVTLPTEAAADEEIARSFIFAGADCVRINCAHDDAETWAAMIANVRRVSRDLGRQIRINMDLGGPKVRTDLGGRTKGIKLRQGDRFRMAQSLEAAPAGAEELPALSLNHPELVASLRPGTEIWFDDGKIGARIDSRSGDDVILLVTSVRPKGEKLKHGNGVNLPGVEVDIPALTEKDLQDLDFVLRHADTIGFSFVQSPRDVRDLLAALDARLDGAQPPGVMLKIETDLAVRNLPRLLVEAGGRLPVAVMIARGDLSVELGMDRTSEMQEEILWLCLAAHVPTVWATQVLENMMKQGRASRAEVTDAAMGQRADCVMLNKGPYAPQAITFLHGILRRMARHHSKGVSSLAPLNSWRQSQAL